MSLTLWDIFAKAWHFTLPSLGVERLLPITKAHTISFGFWLRITSGGNDSQVVSASVLRTILRFQKPIPVGIVDVDCLNSAKLQSITLHSAVRNARSMCSFYIPILTVMS